jgi:phytoene/squalene synthetase
MLRPGELSLMEKLPADGCTPEAAQEYTRWLATHHYENFNVASWLLPKQLHQHFYNLYAYCRYADDLGDEIPERERALELLDWWERELDACYEGKPSNPVFVALRETIVAKDMPKQPFADLLMAFRQDQVVKRYPTWDSVIDYWRISGRMFRGTWKKGESIFRWTAQRRAGLPKKKLSRRSSTNDTLN